MTTPTEREAVDLDALCERLTLDVDGCSWNHERPCHTNAEVPVATYCYSCTAHVARAAIERLRAERDEAAMIRDRDMGKACANCGEKVAAARAEADALRTALREACDEVEDAVNAEYSASIGKMHPNEQRRYDRDMEPVRRWRALLTPETSAADQGARPLVSE